MKLFADTPASRKGLLLPSNAHDLPLPPAVTRSNNVGSHCNHTE